LKQYALPIAKTVGKEVISNVAEITSEALDGKSIKESTREKFRKSIEKLSDKTQTGRGYKRKKSEGKNTSFRKKNKRVLDIFDN
jgi:hypothetical protein